MLETVLTGNFVRQGVSVVATDHTSLVRISFTNNDTVILTKVSHMSQSLSATPETVHLP